MPDFTERQHNIVLALHKDKFALLRELARASGASVSTVAFELKIIRRKVHADNRYDIAKAALDCGWEPRPWVVEEETPEQQMTRLIGDTLPAGKLHRLRVLAKLINHANGNFQQSIDLTLEDGMSPMALTKRLDDLHASLCKVQAALSSAILEVGEQRKTK